VELRDRRSRRPRVRWYLLATIVGGIILWWLAKDRILFEDIAPRDAFRHLDNEAQAITAGLPMRRGARDRFYYDMSCTSMIFESSSVESGLSLKTKILDDAARRRLSPVIDDDAQVTRELNDWSHPGWWNPRDEDVDFLQVDQQIWGIARTRPIVFYI
jgi:hypothetical protein